MKISKLKPSEDNPRKISPQKLKALKESIKSFERMMSIRPIITDEAFVVLGGNQRLRALTELGYTEIPDDWVKVEKGLTDDQKREFMVRDNVSSGDWDFSIIESWNVDVADWGLDLPKVDKHESGEVEFSEYLSEENNYIVLVFDDSVDWLQAQTHFGLKTVYSKRANGKPWSRGVGRVVNGAKYLNSKRGNE